MPASRDQHNYVSRGGLKLAHAIEQFDLNLADLRCADLGCSTGGFTDCLLQHGAANVLSVDTAYGVLEYKLRQDPRVTVRERSNALHLEPEDDPETLGPFDHACDVVVFDLGWTPQKLAIPAALRWLSETGRIISLIKPQYELAHVELDETHARLAEAPPADDHKSRRGKTKEGKSKPSRVLDDELAEYVCQQTLEALPSLGVEPLGCVKSPIRGGATRGQKHGNVEYLALLKRRPSRGAG